MADKKIIDLTALSTQNLTDIYEVSANGTGSFQESRSQIITYCQNHIQNNLRTVDGHFNWDQSTQTFLAGRGAHITGGTDNILLGKAATSNWVGTFIFADSTNTAGGAFFPQGNNQAVFYSSGGFGINCNSSSGVLGPQASFHSAGFNGADGNFLFSARAAVPTANMANSEVNPYINTNQFLITYKGNAGVVNTITFTSGSGTVPYLAASQTFSGTNNFTAPLITFEVQNPLIYNRVATSITATSATITAAQMAGGILFFSPTNSASYTYDTGANLDAVFNTINPNRGLVITHINNSDFPLTFTANTGLTFNGLSTVGSLVIPPRAQLDVTLQKSDNTPTYIIFANSFTPGNGVITVAGTSKTFAASDYGLTQDCTNAATTTLTIPANGTINFPIGTKISILQGGTGQVVMAVAGGVTLNSIVGSVPKSSAQYAVFAIEQISINNWVAYGSITA